MPALTNTELTERLLLVERALEQLQTALQSTASVTALNDALLLIQQQLSELDGRVDSAESSITTMSAVLNT